MDGCRSAQWTRREFLGGLTLAGTAGLMGLTSEPASAEPPAETKTIRLIYDPDNSALCYAPQFIAAQFLRGEGFTDVRYVTMIKGTVTEPPTLAAGRADMSAVAPADLVAAIDAGIPVVALMGLHGGCFELVGTERVRTLRDLKGKKVAVSGVGVGEYLFLASMLAYVGMDPSKDVQWVEHQPPESIRLLAQGKVDAFMAFPPAPQQMRARKIGRVVINTATDRPWSQYACCMVSARREYVHKYPVATKRALRAFVKADRLCASKPEQSARFLVDKGFTLGANYQETLQTLKDVRYGAIWRDYDPEAALLFYALRMHEIGLIKNTPQKIIAQGTDWRFLNELKKELKA